MNHGGYDGYGEGYGYGFGQFDLVPTLQPTATYTAAPASAPTRVEELLAKQRERIVKVPAQVAPAGGVRLTAPLVLAAAVAIVLLMRK